MVKSIKGLKRGSGVQYVVDKNVLNMKEFQDFFIRVAADDYLHEKRLHSTNDLINELRRIRGERIPSDKTCRKYVNDYYYGGDSKNKDYLTYEALARKCCDDMAVERIRSLLPGTTKVIYYDRNSIDDVPMGVILTNDCCETKLAEELDGWQKSAFPKKLNIIAGMIPGIRCVQVFFNDAEDTEMFFEKFVEEFIEYKEGPASS